MRRLANYFETGVTFALFQSDLYSWYPAYGYKNPQDSAVTDRRKRDVFESHFNEEEIPFTTDDLPDRFFEEPKKIPTKVRAIPAVPEFQAGNRPSSDKMIYPDYKELRAMTSGCICPSLITCMALMMSSRWTSIGFAPRACLPSSAIMRSCPSKTSDAVIWPSSAPSNAATKPCICKPERFVLWRHLAVELQRRAQVDLQVSLLCCPQLAVVLLDLVVVSPIWIGDIPLGSLATFPEDHQARKRYLGNMHNRQDWDAFMENVERQDAFEQKKRLKERRFNGGHCSYFHRWFQQPLWRLGQARVGNGPYTLAGEHHEPITRTWEVPNGNTLPDAPSRTAFAHYQRLLQEWETLTEVPVGTPRPLGEPAMGEKWDVSGVQIIDRHHTQHARLDCRERNPRGHLHSTP
eukprot:6171374-Amphidinium_carterae.7